MLFFRNGERFAHDREDNVHKILASYLAMDNLNANASNNTKVKINPLKTFTKHHSLRQNFSMQIFKYLRHQNRKESLNHPK